MLSYTLYRIAMTVGIMGFVVLAMLLFDIYPLTAMMIVLLALLDDLPVMALAYDNTRLDPRPVRWEMSRVLAVSGTLGMLAVAQTFGLLYLGERSLLLDPLHLQSLVFLQLVVGGHLMLFLTRTRRAFWTRPFPSWQLLVAILATQV